MAPAKLGEATGYIQFVSANGKVTLLPGEHVRLPTFSAAAVAAGRQRAFLSVGRVQGTQLRIYTRRAGAQAVQVALSLTDTNHVLSLIRVLFLVISSVAVAGAAVVALLVTRTVLRPVRRLTADAERIAATRDFHPVTDDRRTDELGRLARAFNTMLAALADSTAAQRQLVADASHELRTPLTTARTSLESMQLHPEMSQSEQRQSIEAAVAELAEMTHLIDELVELARGDAQASLHEAVRLDLVARQAVTVAARRTDREFHFEHEPTVVSGAPAELTRAISNLLDNAVKWSSPDDPIEVTVAAGVCSVRDYGAGIASEDVPHVFDRFYRAADARTLPGSGLGLAIVRQVAEAHRGTATAQAAPGGGTIVAIRLPVDLGTEMRVAWPFARDVDSGPTIGGGMERVSDILGDKGRDVLTIASDASVYEMVKQMVEANVGSLLVTVDGRIEGIVTERDYLRRVTLEDRTDKDTHVHEIMSSPLIVVTPETPVDECMAIMTDRRIRHMPVVDDGDVIGVVSIGDLVKFQSKQQSFKIQYLTDYITAR
jgi:two-component system sensor histidine kinase MprB